jgi:hypothetical protein
MPRCAEEEPMLMDVEGRLVACHLYDRDARDIAIGIANEASAVV